MVLISKQEAFFLRNNGFKKYVNMSSKTHKSRSKRYYATEDKNVIKILNEFKDNMLKERHK